MSADGQTYLDASALVKLIVAEAESEALRRHLAGRPNRGSCALVRVEVVRAVRPEGSEIVARARRVLEDVSLVVITDALLDVAADLEARALRSLDAIHVAAAASLGPDLDELVTYDRRMAAAAEQLGLPVAAPA